MFFNHMVPGGEGDSNKCKENNNTLLKYNFLPIIPGANNSGAKCVHVCHLSSIITQSPLQ